MHGQDLDRPATRGGRGFALALLATASLASCAAGPGSAPPPEGLEARLQASDLLHPAFERLLEKDSDLFECLLAIDSFVFPDLEQDAVRRAFNRLCGEARAEAERRVERPEPE